MASRKTVIVTGASKGIGADVVREFVDRGYNLVATSRNISKASLAASPHLALLDGDIGCPGNTSESPDICETRALAVPQNPRSLDLQVVRPNAVQ